MNYKVTFSCDINGKTFNFKNINVIVSRYGAYVPMSGVSSAVRQYMKQRFPQVKFQISSSSFSMGNSVTVYLPCVDEKLHKEINRELGAVFSAGSFNGMYDLYEYRDGTSAVHGQINGKHFEVNTKYMNVENRPKWGTKIYREMESAGQLGW